MTIEELFAEINATGLKINNLFQRHDDRWQANLRDDKHGYEFGRGDTPVAALKECFEKAKVSLQMGSLDDLMG